MVDLGMYIFKDLNTEKITAEESFTVAYIKEVYVVVVVVVVVVVGTGHQSMRFV